MLLIRPSVTHLVEKATVMGHKSSCRGSLSLCLMDKDNYWKSLESTIGANRLSIYPMSVRPSALVENGLARLLKFPVSEKSW